MGPGSRNVTLRAMTETEFEAYLAEMVPRYAADGARACGMTADDALARAGAQIAGLLPVGARTPGHDLDVLEDPPGKRVGVLWTSPREDDRYGPHLFLFELWIDAAHRGRGLGTAALQAVAATARAQGLPRVVLSVFDHNRSAIRLYERLGYVTTMTGEGGRQMALDLAGEDA